MSVMKLALEALEFNDYMRGSRPHASKAITALRQAIEQAEKAQPVARAKAIAECLAVLRPAVKNKFPQEQALEELASYTAPPPRQPLTDEQADECIEAALGNRYWASRSALEQDLLRKAGRAIEAAHGIKETT